MSFQKILNKYQEIAFSERNNGIRIQGMTQPYWQAYPRNTLSTSNDWAEEVNNPRYILDLLLSIINVSVQTVDIVEGLPGLEFDEVPVAAD